MKITNSQAVSELIKIGRKTKKINQADAAVILRISRTKLAMMEVSGDALGSASFSSVLMAIKLAGLEMHLTEIPQDPVLSPMPQGDSDQFDSAEITYQFDDGWT